MPNNKGKKYTAAEKHFIGIIAKLRSEVKELNIEVIELANKSKNWKSLYESVLKDNARQKIIIDKLLERAGMTEEEVRAACKSDESLNGLMGLFNIVSKGTNGLLYK